MNWGIPHQYTVKLFGTSQTSQLQVRPEVEDKVFQLKCSLLEYTTWFDDEARTSQLKIYEEKHPDIEASEAALSKDATLIVRFDKDAPPRKDDRVSPYRNRNNHTHVAKGAFDYIGPQVKHVLFADTSVLKSVIRDKMTLPLAESLCWIGSRNMRDEIIDIFDIEGFDEYWPDFVINCSGAINDTWRRKDVFGLMYTQIMEEKVINGVRFPSHRELFDKDTGLCCDTEFDLEIFFDALVLSKFAKMALNGVKVSFVTFDPFQALLIEMCKRDPIARKHLLEFVDDGDIDELNILTLSPSDLNHVLSQ